MNGPSSVNHTIILYFITVTVSNEIYRQKKYVIQSPMKLSFYYTPTLWGYIAITLSVRSHFRNRYLSFYWKKWFYIWYMALAWWLVPCLPFPGLPHIYFLFTVRLLNERVGVFLARRSLQHLVILTSVTSDKCIQRYIKRKRDHMFMSSFQQCNNC